MKVVVYFRQNPNVDKAITELAVQRRSVAEWIKNKDAICIAEFTELETDAKSRPAFGHARHKAKAENAILLLATTKAIGPRGRFNPVSFDDGPPVVSLEDPEEAARREWARSDLLVVYLRCLRGGGDDAEQSLAKQRDGVALLIVPDMHTVLEEFLEIEDPARDQPYRRPALSAALTLCRERHARLIIGTTDALGHGPLFEPVFTDVPFEVAYRAADQWDEIIEAPDAYSQASIGLHVGGHWVRNRRPLYLLNRTDGDLFDLTITKSGWTLAYGGLVHMINSTRSLERIAVGTSRLVGDYDVFMDCDFTISWQITARDQDRQSWTGGVTIDKKPSCRRLIPLRDWRKDDRKSGSR